MGGFASALGGLGQSVIYNSTSSGGNIWLLWNQGYTTTSNQTYTVDCWPVWNASFAQTVTGNLNYQSQYVQSEADMREAEERRIAAEVATSKAEELLMKVLTPKQREQYRNHGYFETEVNDKVYRIRKGRARNVELLGPNGRPIEQLCAHPEIACPDQDTMISQLLTLEANEAEFRRIANITRLAC